MKFEIWAVACVIIFFGLLFVISQILQTNESDNKDSSDIIEKVKLKRMGVPENQIDNFPKPFGEKFKQQIKKDEN